MSISGNLQFTSTTSGSPAPNAATGSPLFSFGDPSGQGEHFLYFDANRNAENIYRTSGGLWGYNDGTLEAGSPLAATGSPLSVFVDSTGNSHWVYQTSDQHLHQIYFIPSFGWGNNDFTAMAGAPVAASGSPLSAWGDAAGVQHIVFLGTNQHVYQITWNSSSGAAYQDLTASTGAPLAATNSALSTYVDMTSVTHWVYQTSDQHVHQIYSGGSVGSGTNDVTGWSGAPAAAAGSPLNTWVDSGNNQYFIFLGANQHLYQVTWTSSTGAGSYEDLTATAGAPVAATNSALGSIQEASGELHWVYQTSDQHIRQIYWASSFGWGANDLTAMAGAPVTGASSPLNAWVDAGATQHFVYLGTNQHVYQITWNSTNGPSYQDLITTAPLETTDSGTVSLNAGGFSATVCFGVSSNTACSGQPLNSSASEVAAALAAALNVSSSPVSATANGSSINLTWLTPGPFTPSIGALSTTHDQPSLFPNPSFTSPATSFSGGTEGSLSNSYVTLYSYDVLGNLLSVNQKGDGSQAARVRNFTYDSLSRLLSASNPESGAISYSYDADSNLLQKTSPASNQTGSLTTTVSYCYDKLNRLGAKGYTNSPATPPQCAQNPPYLPNPAVAYSYDSGTNGIGRLTSLTDQSGSGAYTYDVMGRTASESRTIAGITKGMSYEYNLDGALSKLHNPSGAVITYTPDSAGRYVSAVDVGNQINYVTGATYGPDSSLTGFVNGNTITSTFSYNQRLQACRMTASTGTIPTSCADTQNHGNVLDLTYNFNLGGSDNGNVYALANNRDHTRDQIFTYDALNRVSSAQNTGTDCTQGTVNGKTKFWGNGYTYDPWGNLIGKGNLPGATSPKCTPETLDRTADAQNRLHVKVGADFQYDSAGNMTYDTTGLNYNYDQENRITGAGGFTYTYDADGNRVEKSNGSTGTLYWYMSPGIVAESDLSGNLQSEYVFFDGERVARRDLPGGAVSYYFSDHLKTIDIVTDAQGNIKNESDFYPWGGELQFSANDSNHYKFTSKERDTETGLDYFGARYYSNGLGRFITPDWASTPVPVPYADLSDPQSLNQYGYVRNVPTTRADADGHCIPFCALIPAVSVRAGEDVQVSGGGKAALEDAGIGAAKGTGSFVYHALMSSNPITMAVDYFVGEPTALQGSNQTQTDAKVVTIIGETVATMLLPGPKGAASEVEASGAAAPKSAPESIPAGPSARPTAAQQRAINEMGQAHGCHTCGAKAPGTKSGNWVGDHQPSTAVNPSGSPQVYKPQCLQCSLRQGGQLRAAQAKAAAAARRAAAARQQHPTN